jgi:biotin carboxyl carrier protein
MKLKVGTTTYDVEVTETGPASYRVKVDGTVYDVRVPPEHERDSSTPNEDQESAAAADMVTVTAPLPGKVSSIEVREGDVVTKGQALVMLESMKMNVAVQSPRRGTVRKLVVTMGQNLAVGQEVAVVD